jgi:hypothetical protein
MASRVQLAKLAPSRAIAVLTESEISASYKGGEFGKNRAGLPQELNSAAE